MRRLIGTTIDQARLITIHKPGSREAATTARATLSVSVASGSPYWSMIVTAATGRHRLTELRIPARAGDREAAPADRVQMMTMHLAKGIEFSKLISR